MGYGIIPNIKDESVLCQKPCKHTDCAAMREDFITNANCWICGKPLKAGDAFYYKSDKGKYTKVHRLCAMEDEENRIK
jgi:hypothetical protein